jgi:anti-sigma factor RsiW
MLSQYDRQQLELISNRLQADDPDLAKALREGRPPPRRSARRWPFVLLAVLAALVFAAGVAIGSVGFMFLGAASIAIIAVFYRRHAHKSPRVRVSRRRFKG